MKKTTILVAATICTLAVVGVLVETQRRSVHARRIDAVLREMSIAFREGNMASARALCTHDCALNIEEWMTAASHDLSSSLGWHPLTDPPQARNPVVEKAHGTGSVDYFPNARWGWPSHYGRFYRFRTEDGEWRFAGYHDVVR
jgi:hypothetical protein